MPVLVLLCMSAVFQGFIPALGISLDLPFSAEILIAVLVSQFKLYGSKEPFPFLATVFEGERPSDGLVTHIL